MAGETSFGDVRMIEFTKDGEKKIKLELRVSNSLMVTANMWKGSLYFHINRKDRYLPLKLDEWEELKKTMEDLMKQTHLLNVSCLLFEVVL